MGYSDFVHGHLSDVHPPFDVRNLPNGVVEVRWVVSTDLPCFQGHFPGNPILPAYATIDLTVAMIEKVTGQESRSLREVEKAKFLSPLAPGESVRVVLIRKEVNKWKAEWWIGSDSKGPAVVIELWLDSTSQG